MTVNEGSSLTVNLAFVNESGVATAPTTLSYVVTDESGTVIVPTTVLNPAALVTMTISGGVNQILDTSNQSEIRVLTATATYGATVSTAEYVWTLVNLRFVNAVQDYAGWNEIESNVLDLIGEDTDNPDVFTLTTSGQALIRDSVNAAIQELAAQTGSYVRAFSLTTLSGRQHYRIVPRCDAFGYFLELWDRSRHYRLEKTSIQALEQIDPRFMQTTGSPRMFYHVGQDVIGLWPIPTETGTVLEGRAVMVPRAYTSHQDPLRLREGHHRAAVAYAVSEFFASRGDAKRAAEAWAEYLEAAQLQIRWAHNADRATSNG